MSLRTKLGVGKGSIRSGRYLPCVTKDRTRSRQRIRSGRYLPRVAKDQTRSRQRIRSGRYTYHVSLRTKLGVGLVRIQIDPCPPCSTASITDLKMHTFLLFLHLRRILQMLNNSFPGVLGSAAVFGFDETYDEP